MRLRSVKAGVAEFLEYCFLRRINKSRNGNVCFYSDSGRCGRCKYGKDKSKIRMIDLQIVETIILVLHVLAALAIIGLVLIQHGKGADMGSGFGSGASATVFGSGGAGNFLSKSTSAIAITFFLTSFGLAYFAKTKSVSARDIGIPTAIEQPDIERKAGDLLLPSLENFDFEKIESEMPENELPSETVVPVE